MKLISKGATLISRTFGFVLVMGALAAPASATYVPEMEPSLAWSAMALLGAGMAMIVGRKRSK